MEYLLVTGLVIGVVQFVKNLWDQDYRSASIIASAAFVGGLCGFFGIEGLDVAKGIVVGLTASGVVTLAQKV